MQERHILIVCGEASGDLNAANLIQEITSLKPGIKISAVGGTNLSRTKAEVFYDIKDLSAFGFFDVLTKLPRFFRLKNAILRKIRADKPDLIVLVDFSGFNLRLAKCINKLIPVIYYISPQIWASRPGRIKTIKEYIHKVIVLFKFEEDLYRNNGVNAEFCGHPLLDIVKPSVDKKEFLKSTGLCGEKTTIALLPGSRTTEIRHILPIMLKACLLLHKGIPNTQFIIAKSPNVESGIYERLMAKANLAVTVIEGRAYDCLNAADFCLVASGTATLETALMQKPFLLVYKMALLNYLLYLPQVKVPFIGMVNIVAGKKVIPEFIQFGARPRKIADEAMRILSNKKSYDNTVFELVRVKALMGENNASRRAAKIIVDFMEKSERL